LLKPHRSYLGALEGLLDSGLIKGLAHITGGGLLENLPRILPAGRAAEIRRGSWPRLAVFDLLAKIGNVEEREMYRTFNMGIGMVVVVSPGDAARVTEHLSALGETHYSIGRIVEGPKAVSLIGQ
jgi:phosphoribosylformylglycinamidine cyclo-ligase